MGKKVQSLLPTKENLDFIRGAVSWEEASEEFLRDKIIGEPIDEKEWKKFIKERKNGTS